MKKLYTYYNFNESIRDLMKPKSKEDIVKALGLSLEEQLIRGLEKGEYWLVKQAIENGADIRYRDDTPLYRATIYEDERAMKLLLKHGAKVTDRIWSAKCFTPKILDILRDYKDENL